MKIDKFLITERSTLREALIQIDANQHGFILTIDILGAVVGLATDGDIRRKLLEGVSLDEPIDYMALDTLDAYEIGVPAGNQP